MDMGTSKTKRARQDDVGLLLRASFILLRNGMFSTHHLNGSFIPHAEATAWNVLNRPAWNALFPL